MVPSQTILARIMTLFSGYLNTGIGAGTWFIKPVKSNFTPGPNLVIGDVTIDTNWTPSNASPISAGVDSGVNPVTMGKVSKLAVGSTQCARSNSATSRIVYGWVLIGGADVMASGLFPAPFTVNATFQWIDLPPVSFELPLNAVR